MELLSEEGVDFEGTRLGFFKFFFSKEVIVDFLTRQGVDLFEVYGRNCGFFEGTRRKCF